ncbi:MAG: hypothetical protein KGJ72_14360, partial [Gammaproteobacteria bacterium]|nr:hypothetical protein [Gammaproteobacteria bacterium]
MPHRFPPRLAAFARTAGFAFGRGELARVLAFAAAGRLREAATGCFAAAAGCLDAAAAVVTLGVLGSDGFAAPSAAGALV